MINILWKQELPEYITKDLEDLNNNDTEKKLFELYPKTCIKPQNLCKLTVNWTFFSHSSGLLHVRGLIQPK